MKKRFCIPLITTLILILSACSQSTDEQTLEKWDCTVTCAENSNDEAYIITYSDKEIISNSGKLSFQNQNDLMSQDMRGEEE